MKKKMLILLGVIVVGGIFAYPQIRNKMLEAEFKRQNPGVDIIGKADGPTAIFTTNNKKTDKNEDIEIIGGANGPTQIYTKK